MTKIVKDRVVILRDKKDGNRIKVFKKGDAIPDHLEHLVTSGAVTGNEDLLDEELSGEFENESETSQETTEEDDSEETFEDPSGLDGMTVPQLRELADEEGADLAGVTRKADIIAVIEANRGSDS